MTKRVYEYISVALISLSAIFLLLSSVGVFLKHFENDYFRKRKVFSNSSDDEVLLVQQPPMQSNINPRIAICLTGQLIRLELGSKLDNLIRPNLDKGLGIDLYVLLDNELEKAKGVKDEMRELLSLNTVYKYYRFRQKDLEREIEEYVLYRSVIKSEASQPPFRVFVRLEPPMKSNFANLEHQKNDMHQKNRFQAHMMWFNGLRNCMMWLNSKEIIEDFHYDFVMRLRDDTYVLKPFKIDTARYKDHVVSTLFGGWGYINDHNIFADRKYADLMFRDFVEDYYFSEDSVFAKTHKQTGDIIFKKS